MVAFCRFYKTMVVWLGWSDAAKIPAVLTWDLETLASKLLFPKPG
jgi:hypothetical protein